VGFLTVAERRGSVYCSPGILGKERVMNRRDIGRRVKAARAVAELKQVELARILGVSQNRISLIERGLSELSARELQTILDHTGLPLAFFFMEDIRRLPAPVSGAQSEPQGDSFLVTSTADLAA
jgi:DNA-binding XRE family transcriptional regulator